MEQLQEKSSFEDEKSETVFIINGVMNYLFWLGKPAIKRNQEMKVMRNEIEKPNSEIFVTALQPEEQ